MSNYHIYKNSDGEYAGSGVTPIRNATHNFTEVAPERVDEDSIVYWDGSAWVDAPSGPHPTPESSEYLPPPAVPESVTKAQLKLALLAQGIDLTTLATQLPANQQPAAQILIDDATEFRRAANMVATLGAIAGLTSDQIDDLFIAAAQIDPATF